MKKLFLLISFVLLSTQTFGAKRLNPLELYEPEYFQSCEPIFIEKISFGGSGCSLADSSGELSDTNDDGVPDGFAVFFKNYIAQQGPGISLAQRRRNCNILVQVHLPQGFQFSIASAKYSGYADLPRGVSGQQESAYQFPLFSPSSITLGTYLRGPYADNYYRTDTLGLASLVWSPCGVSAPLNIRTQIALTGNSTLPAAITSGDEFGKGQQIYGLQWRQCNP